MNDRKLLELAAKAAGIFGEWVENSTDGEYYQLPTSGIKTISEGRVHIWNPLTSSGDSFRLAVKIHLFELFLKFRLEEVRKNSSRSDSEIARLAILRVAAEIGRNIK